MFKHYFEQIDKVEIWPIISLTIFFVFFVGLIIWVVRADKNYINEMRQLPMDDGQITNQNPEHS
ncbi:cytochrome C oxidase Cbb3 [Fulvivirga sedimenti]|jgi:hypothetical protein|uniref:Cytochrome C oxidase Cbb3 n=1 Tax=Fulvivirga sedimenti TaxID=2879465 RepID=A0A9X1HJL4_9BACT|nr:cytochrome C oxidase Cbb3 [Fulvivirga sedimenti]MCA6073260.1 cytochrome C oxidase Cbb3 [Fulvivirga sedimenti]